MSGPSPRTGGAAVTCAAWLLVLAWAATVTWLSALTPSQMPPLGLLAGGMDKLAHFAAFGAGGFLMAHALHRSAAWGWGWSALLAVLAVTLFGVADEIHQLFTPGRSGLDLGDLIADFCGAVAGSQLARLSHRYAARFRSSC